MATHGWCPECGACPLCFPNHDGMHAGRLPQMTSLVSSRETVLQAENTRLRWMLNECRHRMADAASLVTPTHPGCGKVLLGLASRIAVEVP